jgi:predicted ATPase
MTDFGYLRSIEFIDKGSFDQYPFNLPVIRNFSKLQFHSQVTFLVGENGSGKSTLIEAIAVALGLNAEGGSRGLNFATQETHSELHKHLRIVRGIKRPKDGFFLRAESFYNVASAIEDLNSDGGLAARYGGRSLHEQSHGESFISVLRHRLRGDGLYIMDEPEAALSVQRQMEFIRLMDELVERNSQVIIATHSPIILSYPNAMIYQINDGILCQVAYEETSQYQLTKYFLNNYKQMVNEILYKK